MRLTHLITILCSSVLALPASAQTSKALPEHGLTFTLPAAFTDVKDGRIGEQVKLAWDAKCEGSALHIDVYILPTKEFGFEEPEDVMELVLENLRDEKRGDPSFGFTKQETVAGPLGVTGYGSIGQGPIHGKEGTEEIGMRFLFGGIVPTAGYTVEVTAEPAPGPDGTKAILEFLKKGIVYKGEVRNPKWSDAEAKARWKAVVPPKLADKLEPVLRTEHYIIFTSANAKKSVKDFSDQMEKNYKQIKTTYPFEEGVGRKLMPVFLFQTPEQYYDYFAKVFDTSVEQAQKSKGVAFEDWYATWYEAPNDPVHIHEGTHQIFRNRLRLPGGGSWFQEGVAEYICTSKNDRNDAARTVKKGREVPLVEFVKVKSLLFSPKDKAKEKKGDEDAASQYALAACLIEFLRESKFGKDKFQDFLHAVGLVPRSNLAAIQRAVKQVYGVDLAGVEKEWVEYCKKR